MEIVALACSILLHGGIEFFVLPWYSALVTEAIIDDDNVGKGQDGCQSKKESEQKVDSLMINFRR